MLQLHYMQSCQSISFIMCILWRTTFIPFRFSLLPLHLWYLSFDHAMQARSVEISSMSSNNQEPDGASREHELRRERRKEQENSRLHACGNSVHCKERSINSMLRAFCISWSTWFVRENVVIQVAARGSEILLLYNGRLRNMLSREGAALCPAAYIL